MEIGCVAFLEGAQALVRIRKDRSRASGLELDARGAERAPEGDVLGRIVRFRLQTHHVHGVGDALELHRASIDGGDAIHLPGEMHDLAAREDLPRSRDRTQARAEVERTASIAALDGDRLAGVETDAHREGEGGSATVSSTNRRCMSIEARIACRVDVKTQRAPSPWSSSSVPSRRSTVSRTISAYFPASLPAASSPCSCVKVV